MKKLLLFLVLFGIGMGVLWWIEGSTSQTTEATEIHELEVVQAPPPEESSKESEPQKIRTGGPVKASLYAEETGAIKMRLASKSSVSEAGMDRLIDVKLELFDHPKEQLEQQKNLLGTILAGIAEVERLGTEHQRLGQLENISALMIGGHDLTNLRFESPQGVVDLSDPLQTLFTMDDQIQIQSKELSASGLGAEITILNTRKEQGAGQEDKLQFIELDKDARLEFIHNPVTKPGVDQLPTLVKVSCDGSLSLNRIDRQATKSRSFEAWEQAHMNLSGGQDSDLRADHLQGRMRESGQEQQVFLEGISAEGNVLWEYLSHIIRGENMELSSGEDGELSSALISGFPSILLNLKFDESKLNYLREDDVEDKPTGFNLVSISSAKNIQLDRVGERVRMVIDGPATAESEGFLLRSVGDLVMSFPFDPDQGAGLVNIEASGGVELELLELGEQPYSKLETAALELSLLYVEGEGPLDLSVRTLNGSKLEGELKDGRSFTMDTPSSMDFHYRQEELVIEEAFRVTLNIEALRGAPVGSQASQSYQAICEHLIRFNTATDQLKAVDGVSLTNAQGIFTGERIDCTGRDSIELWGSTEKQAHLNSVFGRADADYIFLEGDRFSMRGEVVASLVRLPRRDERVEDLQLKRFDIACSELELQQEELAFQRILRCTATGAVSSELIGQGRFFELQHADVLKVLNTESYASPEKQGSPLTSTLHVEASGAVHTQVGLDRSRFELWSEQVNVDWDQSKDSQSTQDILAQDDVRFQGTWKRRARSSEAAVGADAQPEEELRDVNFSGRGQSLLIQADGTAHLRGDPKERVELNGLLPLDSTQFNLTATDVEFSPEAIDASEPIIHLSPGGYQISALRLVANATRLDLRGRTTVQGKTLAGKPWTLTADSVELSDPTQDEDKAPLELAQQASASLNTVIKATGDVHFLLDDRVEAFGDELRRGALGISLKGDPCTIITRRVGAPSTTVHSKWIDFDPDLQVITEMGSGRITSHREGDGGPWAQQQTQEGEDWSLKFLSFKTELDQDSILFFLEEPYFEKRSGGEKVSLRASYSVIWVAREKWQDINTIGAIKNPEATPFHGIKPAGSMDVFFQFLDAQGFANVVNEVYFEGPVETFRDGKLISHADAVYLDLRSGRGWLTGVTLDVKGSFLGREKQEIAVKANWLRHSKDGSLTADRATITPCDYDEPHLRVVTGELKLTPLSDPDEPGYQVTIRDNRIEGYGLLRVPLPPLEFNTDEELKPQFPSFRFGNTARFGQLLSIKFTQPAKRLGRFFHNLFSGKKKPQAVDENGVPVPTKERKKKPYRAKYDIDASYLSSRGGLVDLGFSIQENNDRYWMEWINGVILDNGRDKGYLRVPKDDRGSIRLWIHAQGQLKLDKSTLGFSFSDQSDPAVQSEFFESQFIHYEQDESYLQWKQREDNRWLQAAVQVRVDESRAGVEELPAVTAFQGRAPFYRIGDTDLIHTGQLNAGYLRRLNPARFDLDRDGIPESTLISPFAPDGNYSDGLGAQDVLRVDTTQVIEAPKSLGVGGLRLTPFTTFHGTYWNNAINDDHAARIVGDVGVRLSTVMWKRTSSGTMHQFAPQIEYRNDIVNKRDGRPFDIDSTERALFGNRIQIGSRSRWDVKDNRSRFDFDFKGNYITDRSDGGPDGWLPIEVYSRIGLNPAGRLFDIWYDGRFDVEKGEAVYSQFSLGTRIRDKFGVQVGYQYGRDSNLIKLFDTASISGFYRWTDKWEFEARQSFSLLVDQQLGFELVLRRYGHDLIFELESSLREGEGSAIGFSVRPRLGFKPNRIGYTNW